MWRQNSLQLMATNIVNKQKVNTLLLRFGKFPFYSMFKIVEIVRCRPALRLLNNFSTTPKFCSESDDNSAKNKKAAALKLQDLLTKLASENAQSKDEDKSQLEVKMSRPMKRIVEKRPVYKIKLDKLPDKHTAQLVAAVKDVADHVGGSDVNGTESELLHVILNNKRPDVKALEELNLTQVISGMQVEKEEPSRAAQVRSSLTKERKPRAQYKKRGDTKLDIFNHKPLDIFPDDWQASPCSSELTTWSQLEQQELKLLITHPPNNIFEEMIRWTERGQLWTFPIDNEQGLEDEKQMDFTQHVFLEEHLEPWCPSTGPIRHFMELVLVGLSKNPHITVNAKIENINWFRDYFELKKKLLMEVGALPTAATDQKQKQIP